MILVVGSSNIDLVASVDRLPGRGETVLGSRFAQSFGGKGANQAIAAARAGADVAFLSKLGADANGLLIERHLAEQGLSRPILLRDAEFPTGVAMILVDHSGENQIAVVPGSNGRLTPADVLQHRELIAGGTSAAASNGNSAGDCSSKRLRLGRECGLTTILNPAPAAPLPSDLLRLIDILTPNETEAQALTGSADPAGGGTDSY
jgi:ribokinase